MRNGSIVSRKTTGWRRRATLFAVMVLGATAAYAYPGGAVDTSFGAGGSAPLGTDADGRVALATSLGMQSDGRIVVAGTSVTTPRRWEMRRYAANGSRDFTFGTAGLTATFGTVAADSAPNDLVVDAGDRAYVAGLRARVASVTKKRTTYTWDVCVVRLTPGGALDPTFGSAGVAVTPVTLPSSGGLPVRVALQADGKLLVASASGNTIRVVRLTSGGALDATYGPGSGVATWAITAHPVVGQVNAVALDGLGRLFVATSYTNNPGTASQSTWNYLLCLTPAGTPDATFPARDMSLDVASRATVWSAWGMAVQLDGAVVVGGRGKVGGVYHTAVLRYVPTGTLDAAFGTGGIVTSGYPTEDNAKDLVLQVDGKIVVGVTLMLGGLPAITAVRLTGVGAIDTTYGVDGWADVQHGPNGAAASVVRMALTADGRVRILGTRSFFGYTRD